MCMATTYLHNNYQTASIVTYCVYILCILCVCIVCRYCSIYSANVTTIYLACDSVDIHTGGIVSNVLKLQLLVLCLTMPPRVIPVMKKMLS